VVYIINKAQKMLNYNVEINFDEGLRRAIEYYIKELKLSNFKISK